MATLRDVAAKVGVSITTVSRVLNDRGSISEKTKAKVFKAMRELNYYPNEMARSLSSKNSHLIGLILPQVSHPFFGMMTDAIGRICYEAGYKLLLCASDDDLGREKELFSMLLANNVAGVLVCSRVEKASDYLQKGFPIVSIERTIEDIPSVSCDNYKGGLLAARELAASGCKYPLLFGTETAEYLPGHLRYKSFRKECLRLGMELHECSISQEDFMNNRIAAYMDRIFTEYPMTDGVFATGDEMAANLVAMLRSSGRKPEDLAIVGFDGIDISEYCDITTVAQPIRRMGELAVDILIKRINGEIVPDSSILPVTLIRRGSSGPKR